LCDTEGNLPALKLDISPVSLKILDRGYLYRLFYSSSICIEVGLSESLRLNFTLKLVKFIRRGSLNYCWFLL
jgi:hypothetical protein